MTGTSGHRAYLDHASTSPARAEAVAAMRAWYDGDGADPGRLHQEGMASRVALEVAREQLAALVGSRPREVVFTSGATEAIAAASWGARERDPARDHVVLAGVEHSAVREWAARGPHSVVGVDHLGRVDPDELLGAVHERTALVQLQWANHEVGTLQPVVEVVERCRDRGVLVHLDAAQAVGRCDVRFTELGADLLSVSGHKFGGPPGTGALLVRRGLRLSPLLVGGDQERARRAGMENVPALVGLGAAADALAGAVEAEASEQQRLSGRVLDWAVSTEGVSVLGDLDQAGVAVHSGSSCSTESLEPSPVLEAMGVDAARSLRISVGWSTGDADVDRLLDSLPGVLERLRALGR